MRQRCRVGGGVVEKVSEETSRTSDVIKRQASTPGRGKREQEIG